MKIDNSTTIDKLLIRDIVKFCCPAGLTMKKVKRIRVTNSRYSRCGRYMGSHILVRVGPERLFPSRNPLYQYAQHKNRRHYLANRIEALVYVTAHELRHAWQGKVPRRNSQWPEGYVRNAKGRWSEVDTEAWAINRVRAWRRMAGTAGVEPATARLTAGCSAIKLHANGR